MPAYGQGSKLNPWLRNALELHTALDGDLRVLTDYLLETRSLTKQYQGLYAVNDVSLKIRERTIHALIGPNGAGKTTCFNLLTKFVAPSTGRILFKGRDITHVPAADVARLGMVRSFQISAVFPKMTALENVCVALQRHRGNSFDFWRSRSVLDGNKTKARELLDQVGLGAFAETVAADMAYGRKRALELATTLALDPELLLLDEPMAGLGHEDVDKIAMLIQQVARDRTVLMVEHNLKVVSSLSDVITVLARGQVLAQGNYAELLDDTRVQEAYLGTGHA